MTPSGAPVATILRFAFRSDRRMTLTTMLLAAGEHLVDVTPGLWLKLVVDAVQAEQVGAAVMWAVVLAGSWLIGAGFRYTNMAVLGRLTDRTAQALDEELMSTAGGLEGLEHFERPDYLDRLQLLQSDRQLLAGITHILVHGVAVVVRVGVTVALLASLHPALLLLPVFAAAPLLTGGIAQRMAQRLAERLAEPQRLLDRVVDLATGVDSAKEVRVFGLADELGERQDQLQRRLRRIELGNQWRAGLVTTAGGLVFTAGWFAAVAFIAVRALLGEATAGDIVLAVTLAGQVNSLTARGVGVVTSTMAARRGLERYRWLIEYAEQARRNRPALGAPPPERIVDGIDLRNISFIYPGTEQTVLRDVSLHIPAGTTIAIVGENGAGKTTLVKLLCGFYAPTTGSVVVDGVPLHTMDLSAWRSRLSSGFQDFVRFELLAREAVGVGDLERVEDPEAVVAALLRATGDDVVPSLPRGLETQLGRGWEDGVELSGGQWQKLGLGRAMMRESPLMLVLDEPTSALDAHTEHALFERFSGAARRTAASVGGITVLVSHRFSTVRMADLIVVMETGTIVDAGSHQELMARGGLYAELYQLQARAYR